MNFEDDEDNLSDPWQSSGECTEDYGSDEEGSGMEEDYEEEYEKDITIAIARVPARLQESISEILHKRHVTYTRDWMRARLPRAWMMAIGLSFPDTPLAEVRSTDPSLLPFWILEGFESYQVRFYMRILLCTGS
jgi:hypothetical protein